MAMKHQADASTVRALRIPVAGTVYSLAIPLNNDLPPSPMHGPFVKYTFYNHEQGRQELMDRGLPDVRIGIMSDRVEMPIHVGTHIDAPNHFCRDGLMLGGVSAAESTGVEGTKQLGIETVAPIVAEGILLDVAGVKGVEYLESGYEITPADLEAALARIELKEIPTHSAVLIRTGWLRALGHTRKYYGGEPGIGAAAGRYLADSGVIAVACDNHAMEVVPHPDPHNPYPVHQRFLIDSYIPIMENVWLEDLVRDGVNRFLFIVSPLPFVGATGSPVAPLAIV